jgi:hypothetical protein
LGNDHKVVGYYIYVALYVGWYSPEHCSTEYNINCAPKEHESWMEEFSFKVIDNVIVNIEKDAMYLRLVCGMTWT